MYFVGGVCMLLTTSTPRFLATAITVFRVPKSTPKDVYGVSVTRIEQETSLMEGRGGREGGKVAAPGAAPVAAVRAGPHVSPLRAHLRSR